MKLQQEVFGSVDDQARKDEIELLAICNAIDSFLQRKPDKQGVIIQAVTSGINKKIAAVIAQENLVGLVLAGLSDKEVERLKKKNWWPIALKP